METQAAVPRVRELYGRAIRHHPLKKNKKTRNGRACVCVVNVCVMKRSVKRGAKGGGGGEEGCEEGCVANGKRSCATSGKS